MVPFTPLYFCLLWGQTHAPWFHLHPVFVYVVGSNPWSHLHPVLVSIMGSNSCSHLHPVLESVLRSNPWSDLLPVLVIKSMVPFTPSLYV